MDYSVLIFFAVFALVAGSFLFRRVKYGSWSGAFLKGSIKRTIGEIEMSRGMGASQTVRVDAMKAASGEEDFVGVVIVSKAPLAASMQPFRLSKSQARQLATYLNEAAH